MWPPVKQSPEVFESLLRRIRAEFLEMPGLVVTPFDAERLWGVSPRTCEAVLRALLEEGSCFV